MLQKGTSIILEKIPQYIYEGSLEGSVKTMLGRISGDTCGETIWRVCYTISEGYSLLGEIFEGHPSEKCPSKIFPSKEYPSEIVMR